MTRIGRGGNRWLAAGLAVAAALAWGSRPALSGEPQPVERTVTWTLPSGQVRTFAFTGTVTGTELAGTLDDGERQQSVAGTVAANGTVSGTVSGEEGVVGTFQGTIETGEGLQGGEETAAGAFSPDGGQAGGAWTAD